VVGTAWEQGWLVGLAADAGHALEELISRHPLITVDDIDIINLSEQPLKPEVDPIGETTGVAG
jgi:hypothetical protein